MSAPGTLWIVATPIGNLDDVSERCRRVLAEVDLIACEDTRRTGRLLQHCGVGTRMLSLHEHNEKQRTGQLLHELEEGRSVALVADAGTPLVCDPGYPLVRAAIDGGFTVTAVPGPAALLTALVVSGLPPYPFTFVGFAPPKSGKRRRFFASHADLGHTWIYYESPHRIERSLLDLASVVGEERPIAVLRELTKLHEEAIRGSLGEVVQRLQETPPRGELVVVVAAADRG